jgi:hypothetical protein
MTAKMTSTKTTSTKMGAAEITSKAMVPSHA